MYTDSGILFTNVTCRIGSLEMIMGIAFLN